MYVGEGLGCDLLTTGPLGAQGGGKQGAEVQPLTHTHAVLSAVTSQKPGSPYPTAMQSHSDITRTPTPTPSHICTLSHTHTHALRYMCRYGLKSTSKTLGSIPN